jgi:flagellar hook-basal body complex protein FliE
MPTSSFAAGAYAAAKGLGGAAGGLAALKPPANPAGQGPDFSALVRQAVEGVGASGRVADAQMAQAATGNADLVNVVTAVAESEAAIETLVAVRDRVIAAYEEIMRMQV